MRFGLFDLMYLVAKGKIEFLFSSIRRFALILGLEPIIGKIFFFSAIFVSTDLKTRRQNTLAP
jgi:hypothetical protein